MESASICVFLIDIVPFEQALLASGIVVLCMFMHGYNSEPP